MTENLSHINIRHKTTDLGRAKNTERDKCQPTNYTKAYHFQVIYLHNLSIDFPFLSQVLQQSPGPYMM